MPIVQLNRSIYWNGYIEQWLKAEADSGSGKAVILPISYTSKDSYVTNVDRFFLSSIGAMKATKTANSLSYDWDVRTVIISGIIAMGY